MVYDLHALLEEILKPSYKAAATIKQLLWSFFGGK